MMSVVFSPLCRASLALLCMLALSGCVATGPVTPDDYGRENILVRTQQVPDEARWRRATQLRGLGDQTVGANV